MDLDYRKRANYLIEKNRLNITTRDIEYKHHIKSIDAFLKDNYKESYRLARLTQKMYKSHDVLKL